MPWLFVRRSTVFVFVLLGQKREKDEKKNKTQREQSLAQMKCGEMGNCGLVFALQRNKKKGKWVQ